jgi:type IV secretion system protein VirB9
MKKSLLFFMCLISLWSSAYAEEDPIPGREDTRMRYVAYDSDQVVRLAAAVGATLVVTFGSKERVVAVAVSDSADLAAMPRGNYLFFKARRPLPPQPVIVLTETDTGMRRYVFEMTAVDMANPGADQTDLSYSVQFTYPAEAAAEQRRAAAASAAAQRAQEQAQEAAYELKRADYEMEHDPFVGPRNWHYVAQGDRSLLPLEVYDNGYTTVFRFPGNVRIPAIFVINPDGKEATANYAVKGDLVEADSVARGWRLRDGQTVLCIWNLAFNPVGRVPGTGTVSPNVQRILKESAQ